MSNYKECTNCEESHLVKALKEIAPAIYWEDISTGGGCTCIWGHFKNKKARVIMITDGDAHSPENFAEESVAIYWENHEMNEHWSKAWTEPKPFFELLTELKNDLYEWENEETELEKLMYRLGELATELEMDDIVLHPPAREQLIDDLKTAVELLNTHAKSEG
jgi:hypothetical protein